MYEGKGGVKTIYIKLCKIGVHFEGGGGGGMGPCRGWNEE